MPIRLVSDTALPVTSHTAEDTVTICSRRHDTTGRRLSMPCSLSLGSKHIATEGGDLTDIKNICEVMWACVRNQILNWWSLLGVTVCRVTRRPFSTRKEKDYPVGEGINDC